MSNCSISSPPLVGELTIIWGPMFASKSSELISQLEKYQCVDIPVLGINHIIDNRYSEDHISTHSGKQFPSLRVNTLTEVFEQKAYQDCHVVGLDEAHFFPDLYTSVLRMVEKDNKIVFVAGLNGTYQRKLFGDLHHLVPLANHIITLHAVCADCRDGKTPGIFTKRLQPLETFAITVGNHDTYKPVCRKHFLESKGGDLYQKKS